MQAYSNNAMILWDGELKRRDLQLPEQLQLHSSSYFANFFKDIYLYCFIFYKPRSTKYI